jgi:hypothetical protein
MEAQGTVSIKATEDLRVYNKSEEIEMEEIIKGIKEAGVKDVNTDTIIT